MERDARNFVRRVLFYHALAIVALAVLAMVGMWNAYRRSQEQAIEQAGVRQQLVAQQTARGLENFFSGIADNLRLMTREELREVAPRGTGPGPRLEDAATTQPASGRLPDKGSLRDELRERLPLGPGRPQAVPFLNVVWKQIDARASHLIAYNVAQNHVLQAEQRPGTLPAEALLAPARQRLLEVERIAVTGRFEVEGFSYILFAVRFADDEDLQVVAVVPLEDIAKTYIDGVSTTDETIGVLLFDDRATVVAARRAELVGVNFESETVDPNFRRMVRRYRDQQVGIVERFENMTLVGGLTLDRGLVAIEPLMLPDGKRWFLSVGADLRDVGGLVNEIFRGTLFWTPILVLLFAGVMVSTAVTLIRSRSRLERFKFDVLQGEIEQARHIQLSWLPPPKFEGRGIVISAVNTPASHVSGDFYNYFVLPDGREAVVIGDVTGHGMAAAFLMSTTQLLIRSLLNRTGDPVLTVNEVNRELCGQAFSGQFVTLLLIVIDQENGELDVVSAGHPPPLMIDDGNVRLLPTSPQLVLGVEPDVAYESETFPFRGACSLLLYTDGVIECREPGGKRFSIDAFVAAMNGVGESPDGVIARMIEVVDAFRKTEPLTDDATAIALRVLDEAGMTDADARSLSYSV
jgi:Stage II sporulation protein E (SpoIIE)